MNNDNHIVLCFGRFSGITKSHQNVLEKTKKFGDDLNAKTYIYASHSHDKKTNPIEYNKKIELMKKMLPHLANNIQEDPNSEVRTPIEMLKKHSDPNKTVHIFAGDDRIESYKNLFDKYNGKDYQYKNIIVHNTNERKDGISGTELRHFATSGDFKSFAKYAPTTAKEHHIKEMYNTIRNNLIKENFKTLENFLIEAKQSQINNNPKKVLSGIKSKTVIHPDYSNYSIKTHKDSDKSQPESQNLNPQINNNVSTAASTISGTGISSA